MMTLGPFGLLLALYAGGAIDAAIHAWGEYAAASTDLAREYAVGRRWVIATSIVVVVAWPVFSTLHAIARTNAHARRQRCPRTPPMGANRCLGVRTRAEGVCLQERQSMRVCGHGTHFPTDRCHVPPTWLVVGFSDIPIRLEAVRYPPIGTDRPGRLDNVDPDVLAFVIDDDHPDARLIRPVDPAERQALVAALSKLPNTEAVGRALAVLVAAPTLRSLLGLLDTIDASDADWRAIFDAIPFEARRRFFDVMDRAIAARDTDALATIIVASREPPRERDW
jgi:hypothetical protein